LCYNLATDAQIFNAKPTKFFAKFEKENFKDYIRFLNPSLKERTDEVISVPKKSVQIRVIRVPINHKAM
jgi:hypothetical protein